MRGQAGFFDVDERLKELSAKGDDLERLNAIVDFELFRPDLERAVPRSDGSRGGRPPFDHVFMFKILILQASHSLSDERTEYLIKDRLSFMRFLGLALADTVPDANTIWTFREALTRATLGEKPAIEVLFRSYETALTKAGFLAMGGQIVDASIVAAPKQRNSDGEKRDIRNGRIPEAWKDQPAKLAQKDRDARWTVKFSKGKPDENGAPRIDLAVPAFGYKNHITIDREHGLIRTWTATDAARHDGAQLPTWSRTITPQAPSGPTPPIGRRPMSSTSPTTGSGRRSTVRSRRASRCRSTSRGRTAPNPRSDRRSSTSSPGRRDPWA